MATYLELDALRRDAEFLGRTSVAVVLYADMVIQQTAASPAPEPAPPVVAPHANALRAIAPRLNWALNALRNPDEQVYRIMGSLLADAVVQAKLGAISDAELSVAVAAAIELQMAALI